MESEIYDKILKLDEELINNILKTIEDIELLRKEEVAYRINIAIERMKQNQPSTIKNEEFNRYDLEGLNEDALKKIYERLSNRKKSAESIVDATREIYYKIKNGDL